MLQKLFPPIPHMKDPLGNNTHSERMVRQGPACEGGEEEIWGQGGYSLAQGAGRWSVGPAGCCARERWAPSL